MKNEIKPGLYVVSTPIGNLEDITLRALKVLKNSHFILCEDTRRSSKLLSFYKIKKKLISYHKFNETKVSNQVIDLIKKDNVIALISDAGTPTISDPGISLVNRCINENLRIHPVPGVSAVTTAMSVSGFNHQYLFYGFLPKKVIELEKKLKILKDINYSFIFFVSPKQINFYLRKFKQYFLNRRIFIAKEMTKIHEFFIKNDVEKLEDLPSSILKGEFTIVLSQIIKEKKQATEINETVRLEIKKMLKKYSHKDVVEFISKKENLSKKHVYDFCLIHKKKK